MQYRIRGNEVVQTTETNGTIQNISDAEAEISTSADFNDSFVLRGWDRITFTSPLYIRARAEKSSLIILNVLQNFFLSKGGEGLSSEDKEAISQSFKAARTEGNTVSFFTDSDTTGTAAFSFDFPEEIFLDQLNTGPVENFSWSALAYPNSVNPNLEGKTVFVLAVKGDKTTNPTIKYSFVNMEKFVDTYTASDTSITISGYKVAVNISAEANNAITKKNDGLHVDISGKVDKVKNATAGNVPFLASDGTLTNSAIIGEGIFTDVKCKENEIQFLNCNNEVTKVVKLPESKIAVRYGVKISKGEPSPTNRVEYIYDAVGFTPAKMNFDTGKFEYGTWADVWFIRDNKPLMLKYDGTVDYYLYENDYSIKANGDDVTTPSTAADSDSDVANANYEGNAMCQIPLVWLYSYEDDEYHYLIVSNVQWDENYKAYAHTRSDGTIANYFYHALFNGTGDATKIRSISGRTPFKNLNGQQIFDAAAANGEKWCVESWSQRSLLCTLLIIMAKSTDLKTAFGAGRYRPLAGTNNTCSPITAGSYKTNGQFFGYKFIYTTGTGNSNKQIKVFHIESFWAENWKVTAGLLCKNGDIYVKMTPENGGYSLTDTTGYAKTGFIIGESYLTGQTETANNFITNIHGGDFGLIPCDPTVSLNMQNTTSTYYCAFASGFPKGDYVDSDTLLADSDTVLKTTYLSCGGEPFGWNINPNPFNFSVNFYTDFVASSGNNNLNIRDALICCEG